MYSNFVFAVTFIATVRPRDEPFVDLPIWGLGQLHWENCSKISVKTNFIGALMNSLLVGIGDTAFVLAIS